MTDINFQFVIALEEDVTAVLGVQFFDGNIPIDHVIFGKLTHELLDFMIEELQEIKANELIPLNTAIH